MVQKITQQNQALATRTAHAVLGVVQVWQLATASADFYLTPSMLTEILRLGRFAPGAGDDTYVAIATVVARKANARDTHANEHSNERGRQIYGQIA